MGTQKSKEKVCFLDLLLDNLYHVNNLLHFGDSHGKQGITITSPIYAKKVYFFYVCTIRSFFSFSDEVRVPGVITYSTCNVNSDAMMNKKTGHISVKHPGDYYLSFTANMVSVNSQAIWCAIYKQTAGNDAWQVLGKIDGFFGKILFLRFFS